MGILRTDKISGLETPTAVTNSVLFDGNDYLSIAEVPELKLGTNDFTIEAWINFGADVSDEHQNIIAAGNPEAANSFVIQIREDPSRLLDFRTDTRSDLSTSAIPLNEWTHIAVTKESNVVKLFINGVLENSATEAEDLTTAITAIGYRSASSYGYVNGYISNLRVIKGRALYTADFTVPVHALEPINGTVLLCCNNSDSVTAASYAGIGTSVTLTANGDPTVSTVNPGLTRDFTSGTEFKGVTTFDTQGYFVPPSGTTEQRGRGRAVFGGGDSTGQPYNTSIEYFQLQTSGMSFDFGDLTLGRNQVRAVSSSTRGVFGGGRIAPASAVTNTMDYVTIATTSNAVDFGDLSVARGATAPASNSTRGVFMAGYDPANTNHIDYITIASLGNATDFGDTLTSTHAAAGCASPTRGIMAGGQPSINTIEYITIASTGNSVDFGDRVQAQHSVAGCSSQTRGIFGGGTTPGTGNIIDYITISTLGNAQDFGDLVTASTGTKSATSNQINGCFFAGWTGSAYVTDVQKVIIASTGNAVNFGSLMLGRHQTGATSDSHGGIS